MVLSPGMVHGKDLTDGCKGHDLGQEKDDKTFLKRDHRIMTKTEGIVHHQVDVARVQGKDAEIDHVREDQETDHVRESAADLETDHVREDEVDQGTGNLDTTADHLDVNSIFLI